MVRHRLRNVLCVVVMAVAPALVPAPALASISGEVAFECEIRLPAFPTPAASGWCGDGALPALADVSASGTADDGSPYLVYGVGPTGAVFEYSAACVANEPALLATVQGTATVWDLPALHGAAFTTAVAGVRLHREDRGGRRRDRDERSPDLLRGRRERDRAPERSGQRDVRRRDLAEQRVPPRRPPDGPRAGRGEPADLKSSPDAKEAARGPPLRAVAP